MQRTISITFLIASLLAACTLLAIADETPLPHETLCNQGVDSECEALDDDLDRAGWRWIADNRYEFPYANMDAVPWNPNDDQGCGYITNPGVDANDVADWVECQVQGVKI